MRKLILYLSIILSLSTGMAKGQAGSDNTPDLLEKLFDRLVSNYADNDRLRINDSIRFIIDGYVESDTVFNHKFTNLRYLGQITSPDSLIKIIAWNLVLDSGQNRYFCYFIKKKDSGKGNKIYKLAVAYRIDRINADTIYTERDWYGALYYAIKPIITDNGRCWILLGIDFGNPLISRKVIDVVSFSSDDSLIFGRKWFSSGNAIRYREVFEYSSDGMMSLRFSSDTSIVFDHLVPFSPALKDNHQYYGPDYSYDAYSFENGLWKLKVNVDVRNRE
jgi:hypothetical protein